MVAMHTDANAARHAVHGTCTCALGAYEALLLHMELDLVSIR